MFELFAICNQLGVLQKGLHVSLILDVQNLHIYFDKNMQTIGDSFARSFSCRNNDENNLKIAG